MPAREMRFFLQIGQGSELSRICQVFWLLLFNLHCPNFYDLLIELRRSPILGIRVGCLHGISHDYSEARR